MSSDTQRRSAKGERDLANARRDAAKWRRRHARLRAGLAQLLEQDRVTDTDGQGEQQEEREERFG